MMMFLRNFGTSLVSVTRARGPVVAPEYPDGILADASGNILLDSSGSYILTA